MPSASSPAPAMPSSPKASTGSARPGLPKRHSSHSTSGQTRQAVRDAVSPGSHPEGQQALRHPVRSGKHARIVLPRNHSSGRNLAKMGRAHEAAAQRQHQQPQNHHGRNRSHENDTEIRLPGSLDESTPVLQQQMQQQQRPAMRRNMTSYHLSRNQSHTKLKKNHSHGALQRLNSRGNLAALGGSGKAPPSPGLKGRSKRPKSADMSKWALEKDLHEQEVELAQRLAEKRERGGGPKKVGFAVGSSGDSADEEAVDMDGHGMEEGDWTEESTSASPYSTRQNTANNSRRESVVQDRSAERVPVVVGKGALLPERLVQVERPEVQQEGHQSSVEENDEDEEKTETETEEDDETPSPRSTVKPRPQAAGPTSQPAQEQRQQPQELQLPKQPISERQQPPKISQPPRSPLHAAREHPNPTMPYLRNASGTLPAPAMTSNVNALDSSHSVRGSPATSTLSTGSASAGDAEQQELVSRFIPSTSHPYTGSNPTTTQNTPKMSSFHTPEADSSMHRHNKNHSRHTSQQHPEPISPGNSTISGSSGTATPALGRSRTELKMLQEKAMADIHSAVDRNPFIPAHVYDRRNESLKSYLNLAALSNAAAATNGGSVTPTGTNTLANSASTNLSLGPEIFQGRFKAVHTELRVVQKFRDPLAESLTRLRACKGSRLSRSPQKVHAAALRTSKSAVSLPAAAGGKKGLHSRAVSGAAAEKGLSGSPLKGGPVGAPAGLQSSRSSVNVQGQGRRGPQRGVSFVGGEGRDEEERGEEESVEAVARRLWGDVGGVGA
ncbi:hypothetical protein WHR41_05350 [Cladosporium halotolerans]|uniref:Uncharacterized protein n=1 Tax=Cladosporium halotolerans TaxID=1052096 RepID=A0AB34KSS5_9PEZI